MRDVLKNIFLGFLAFLLIIIVINLLFNHVSPWVSLGFTALVIYILITYKPKTNRNEN